uniref:Uncharacterized protein n=1 Tax=Arundo donax TaxID=35708 RepID=A0A0A9F9S4_ARUDO
MPIITCLKCLCNKFIDTFLFPQNVFARCYYVRRSPLHQPQYLTVFPQQVRRRSSEELNELIKKAQQNLRPSGKKMGI